MNPRLAIPALALSTLLAVFACAPRMILDESLKITVKPEPVVRGEVGIVTVNAPMEAQEVVGVVRVAGSPEFVFARDRKKGLWYFTDKMPITAWNPPGKYVIRIIVKDPPAKPRYAEREIELK